MRLSYDDYIEHRLLYQHECSDVGIFLSDIGIIK